MSHAATLGVPNFTLEYSNCDGVQFSKGQNCHAMCRDIIEFLSRVSNELAYATSFLARLFLAREWDDNCVNRKWYNVWNRRKMVQFKFLNLLLIVVLCSFFESPTVIHLQSELRLWIRTGPIGMETVPPNTGTRQLGFIKWKIGIELVPRTQ